MISSVLPEAGLANTVMVLQSRDVVTIWPLMSFKLCENDPGWKFHFSYIERTKLDMTMGSRFVFYVTALFTY